MHDEPPIAACELHIDELVARPYRAGDAAALADAVQESNASLARWLDWCQPGYGLADAEQWIELCRKLWDSGDQYTFAVFDAAASRLLGAVGLNQHNRRYRFAGLGYWMRDSARGRGITVRVGRQIVRFGFERVGLDRVEILAAVDNHISRRTAERLGARFEGVQRNRLRLHERAIDAAMYALTPADLDGQALAQTRARSS